VIVTEKATSRIDVYPLDGDGRAGAPAIYASAGSTPFGFELTREGVLVVSEAASASMSSYELGRGELAATSSVVPDTQAAPCWVAIAQDDRIAWTANAGSSSISAYAIDPASGALRLVAARAGEVGPGSRPLDMALDHGGRHLYVVDRGTAQVIGFDVGEDGALASLDAAGPLPPVATGIAAY
jgi:6-phosphogluconolactonase (cycloisomerase 2 family)